MLKILRNPLYIYVLGFTLVFIVYNFGWSNIYPELTFSIKLFFTITFILFILSGQIIDKLGLIKKTFSNTKLSLIRKSTIVLLSLYLIEFIVEQDIPLLSQLNGTKGVNYREFGIPLLHGLLISFNSFLIAHSFNSFKSKDDKRYLKYNLILYIPALLFLSRSILMLGGLTSLFIYLQYINKLTIKNLFKLITAVAIALYFFGVIGNLRSGGAYIYEQSKVSDKFTSSSIPKEYYWTYLYVASPLANFQNTINLKKVNSYNFKEFVFFEAMPQMISKKFDKILDLHHRDLVRIVPWLTVGTAYAESYSYLNWYGCYLLVLYHLLVYLIIIIFLVPKTSSYHITTNSILSVIILLSVFGNILTVTGIFFQLAFCIVFALFENKKFVIKR